MKLLSLFKISFQVNTKSNTTYIFLCLQLQNVSHRYTPYRSRSFPSNPDPSPLFWLFRSTSLSFISYLRRLWTREASMYRFLLSFGTIHSQRQRSYRPAWQSMILSLTTLMTVHLFKTKTRKISRRFYTLRVHVTRDAILEICVYTVIVTWLRENHNKKIYL